MPGTSPTAWGSHTWRWAQTSMAPPSRRRSAAPTGCRGCSRHSPRPALTAARCGRSPGTTGVGCSRPGGGSSGQNPRSGGDGAMPLGKAQDPAAEPPLSGNERLSCSAVHLAELTAVEQRVLGCLIEKRRTTPDQYPLSLNALRLACNQLTNREPVTAYDERQVREAADRLCRYGLARLASGHGSRAVKYRHLAEQALSLDREELAILAVLLLRGAQTRGELKARAERMASLPSLADVDRVLETLISRGYARRLSRRPGQKEERFQQLLGATTDSTSPGSPGPGATTPGSAAPATPGSAAPATPGSPGPGAASPGSPYGEGGGAGGNSGSSPRVGVIPSPAAGEAVAGPAALPGGVPSTPRPGAPPAAAPPGGAPVSAPTLAELTARLERLEAQVSALRQELAELRVAAVAPQPQLRG